MKIVTTAACICALLALLLFPVFAVPGMVLALMIVARGKLNHGIALLAITALCGYLGMVVNLPYGDFVWRTITNSARMAQASVAQGSPAWHIVSLESRVTKADHAQSVCSWRLVVRNDSPQMAVFRGKIEFQDAEGVKLFEEGLNADRTAKVAPASEAVFTGSQTISSNKKVARAVPSITTGG